MSKAFFIRLNFLEFIKNEINFVVPNTLKLGFFGIAMGCHFCYAIGTKKEQTILINKKYEFTKQGFTEFMIIDENGKHYNVNNSVWYWKWNSIEDWNTLETNTRINVKYYGWRIPILGMFPVIVSTKDKEKDPNNTVNYTMNNILNNDIEKYFLKYE
jgi:hypothetical protein